MLARVGDGEWAVWPPLELAVAPPLELVVPPLEVAVGWVVQVYGVYMAGMGGWVVGLVVQLEICCEAV